MRCALAFLVALWLVAPRNSAGAEPPRQPDVELARLPAIPAGPYSAVAEAVLHLPGTEEFPYGKQYHGTQLIYFQLCGFSQSRLEELQQVMHHQPTWLRDLMAELARLGFDSHSPTVQAEGARLLSQVLPYRYPPVSALTGREASLKVNSTAFYDPASGVISLADRAGRWPRAVSLWHEATHAQQSEPGPVSWAALEARPWSARTWLYSASRDNPKALDATVELGPSLLSGLATVELYHRCQPKAGAIRTQLVPPSGRAIDTEWMLRQAHRFGIFGATPTARELGYEHEQVVGINELLGQTTAGRRFVASLIESP